MKAKPNSKRWRKWRRSCWRRTRAICLARLDKPARTDREIARRNTAAKILNARVRYPRFKGYSIISEACSCSKCGREVLLESDPCEWCRRQGDPDLRGIVAKWRRGRDRDWSVTDYWGGVGHCCGLMYACQPDGAIEVYKLEPPAQPAAEQVAGLPA